LVLARALESTEETIPYCYLVGLSAERERQQLPILIMSRKFKIGSTRRMLLFAVILIGLSYLLGSFSSRLVGLWKNLSLGMKSIIGFGIMGVFLAVLINIFSAFLYSNMHKIFRALISKPVKKLFSRRR